jgi:hypothetical protein
MLRITLGAIMVVLTTAASTHAALPFFNDFENGVSRDTSGGLWTRFDVGVPGLNIWQENWLESATNHNHTPGGSKEARAYEHNPGVYNSYADFGATGDSLRATVYLFEDMNYVPPYEHPVYQVTNMLSLWGDSGTGPEARTEYIQLGVAPNFPGGGTTFGFRTKYNDDNALGIIDTGVQRKESEWLKMSIEVDSVADGGEIRFFLDDVPVGTSQRSGADLRWVMLGGLTYTYENYWYDDVSVESLADPILPGDYDFDDVVDGADFLAWQRGESFNRLSPGDLQAWKDHFGPLAVATASPVPEPGCLVIVGVAAAVLLGCTRSHRWGATTRSRS